jgi:hypothetical protein
MNRQSAAVRVLAASCLAVVLTLSARPAIAALGVNRDADEILRSMSSFLAGTKAFSVAIDSSNEVITQDGEKLQFNASATVLVERPSHMHLERQGKFADLVVNYDGSKLTLYGKRLNAYIQKDLAGTIDNAIAAVEGDMGLSVPASDLLLSAPYAALASGVTASGYYGKAYVQGVECEHLAFRAANVDWQIWVKTGDEPLPMKYVITTKWMTGAPQYSVQFSRWNTKPVIKADQFTFVIPKGAKKMEALPVDETGELRSEQEGEGK